jgi:hypothetical protein
MTETKRYDVLVPGCKDKFKDWIDTRGGVVVWKNIDLGNSGTGRRFTPKVDADGKYYGPPHWSFGFEECCTSLDRFRFVKELKEVRRIKIAIERGSGLSWNLTEASSRRLRKAMDGYPDAVYHFEGKEAVIETPVLED